MSSFVEQLHNQIEAAAGPIFGVSVRRKDNKSTWAIHYNGVPTPAQEVAAQAVIASFDITAAEAASAAPSLTVDDVVAMLVKKGALTQSDVHAASSVKLSAKKGG